MSYGKRKRWRIRGGRRGDTGSGEWDEVSTHLHKHGLKRDGDDGDADEHGVLVQVLEHVGRVVEDLTGVVLVEDLGLTGGG